MRIFRTALSLVALLLTAPACEKEAPDTLIRLVIDSDLEVGTELTKLEVRILDREGKEELRRQDFALGDKREGTRYALPLSIKLVPESQRGSADFRLVVTGKGPMGPGGSDVEVVEQQATASFRPGEALRLDVFLARSCLFKLCRTDNNSPSGLTCDVKTGECADVPARQDLPTVEGDGVRQYEKGDANFGDDTANDGGAVLVDSQIEASASTDADASSHDAGSDVCSSTSCLEGGTCSRVGSSACTNINECVEGSDDCAANATCTQSTGTYRCTCNPPYIGNGKTCACPAGTAGVDCSQCSQNYVRNDDGVCVQTAQVSITFAGDGFGRVTFSDGSPPCTQTCTVSWPLGGARTMTAEAGPTSRVVNWDRAECSPGYCYVQATTATTELSIKFELQNNVAFLLPTEHTPAEIGGIASADTLCRQAAAQAGLHGTMFRAWLSAEGASTATSDDVHAIDRLVGARGWVRPDGYPVADRPTDLVTKGPLFPLYIMPNRQRKVPTYYTWTGSEADGHLARDAQGNALTCGDWQLGADNQMAAAGDESNTRARWTRWHDRSCSFRHTLYCFGTDTSIPMAAMPPVTGGRLVFATKGNITLADGVNGLAAMDNLCAQEASAAQLSGTFKALVYTTAGLPTVRVSQAAGPWVRVDGTIWADASHNLKDLHTGLLYADGTSDYRNYAAAFAGDPTRGFCQNWTTPNGNMFSYVIGCGGDFISMNDVCANPSRAVCVQD